MEMVCRAYKLRAAAELKEEFRCEMKKHLWMRSPKPLLFGNMEYGRLLLELLEEHIHDVSVSLAAFGKREEAHGEERG